MIILLWTGAERKAGSLFEQKFLLMHSLHMEVFAHAQPTQLVELLWQLLWCDPCVIVLVEPARELEIQIWIVLALYMN
jgi:hypothetical protein